MYHRLFQNRDFVALWLGQTISFIGDYFNWLAVPITINRLTGSATMVGLSFIFNSIPALVLGPFAGVFVDRWDRRRVMIVSDVLRGLLVLCLLTIRSANQVWIFYLIGFLISCTSQFFIPARGAVLPLIVTDQEDWLAANGMMQIVQTIGMLAGPALAGFAIGQWGAHTAFIANSIGYLASAAAVLTIRVPRTTPGSFTGAALRAVFQDLRDGLSFLVHHRATVGVTVSMAVAFLGVGAINVIWVPYLQRAFGVGAQGLGIVDSAMGMGMLISGAILGWIGMRVRRSVLTSTGLLVMGILFGMMGYSPAFSWIVVENFFVGLFLLPVQSASTTILQIHVPDLKRGRVMSSITAITTCASLLSMAFASFLGERIGLNNVYLVVGAFISLSGTLSFWLLAEQPVSSPANVEMG
ncbi:MAG TPA: MFS transporter [Anaerolineaceae bacterium]|nr:MFS transporter [Anaerolineaceae bacterium]